MNTFDLELIEKLFIENKNFNYTVFKTDKIEVNRVRMNLLYVKCHHATFKKLWNNCCTLSNSAVKYCKDPKKIGEIYVIEAIDRDGYDVIDRIQNTIFG